MRGGAKRRLDEALGSLNTDLRKFWINPKRGRTFHKPRYPNEAKLLRNRRS